MRRGRARGTSEATPPAVAGALAIALAACFSDRGVVVEVDVADTRAIEVELYLGKTRCDATNPAGIDCTAIAPPDGKVALGGTIWFRDDIAPYRATVSGHTATFHLTADSPTTLPVAIAVGRALTPLRPVASGVATLHDLEIPVHSGRVVKVALAAATTVVAVPNDTKNLDEDRVREWSKGTPESSCVVVEHWDGGQVTREFIVPAEDPDCDDVAKPECNPAAYHGAGSVGGAPAKPDCVVDSAGVCVLGNGCSDDAPGQITDCTALDRALCIPSALCGCTSLTGECIRGKIEGDPLGVPRIACAVPTTPLLGMCSGDNSATVDLVAEYQGRGCGRQPLLATLQATGFSTTRTFGGATFELGGAGDQCKFTVSWKSGMPRVANDVDLGFVVLETRSGAVLLPIEFKFLSMPGACTAAMDCSLVDTTLDSMWSCVQ